ncbi:MAG: pyridoxal 5'-phosphate synthase glutaminase subunit PdxT [Acidimicrobiales bacterium]
MSPARRHAPRVGIVALQGDVAEHAAVLEDLGAAATMVRAPIDARDLDALVLPGGESTTMSMLLEWSGLRDEISKMVDDGLPMLGTCAGMILLARQVLDGRPDQVSFGAIDIAVRRNAFGRQLDSFETDLRVDGLRGGPMHAVFIRAPVVEETGAGVDVLASLSPGPGAPPLPVVCSEGPVIVAAFHPELAGDRRLHELLLQRIEGD